jgi:hypothetical protein
MGRAVCDCVSWLWYFHPSICADELSQPFTPKMTKQKLRSLAYVFRRYGPEARTCLNVAGDKEEMNILDGSVESSISDLPANKN